MSLANALRSARPISPPGQRPLFDDWPETEGEDLRALPASVLREMQDVLELAVELAQFSLARAHEDRPSTGQLGALAWAADLSPDSFEQFATEYIESVASAILKGDWYSHQQFLTQWRDTALVERDPELMERVAPADPDQYNELGRPTASNP